MKAKKPLKNKSLSVEVPAQKFLASVEESGEIRGTFLLELYPNEAPKFCEFFTLNSCSTMGDKGKGKHSVYKKCPFKRITKIGIQIADGQPAKATPVEIDPENSHTHCPGSISFCKSALGFDTVSFFVCLSNDENELAHLDKNYVVFGKVVENIDFLYSLRKELANFVLEDGVISPDCPLTVAEITLLGEGMLVSESCSTFLNLELITLLCDVAKVYKLPVIIDDSVGEIVSARTQLLDNKGFLLGSQITERLLVRELVWSGSPADVARFVGNNFWSSVFGKKVDSVKVMSNTFHFREKNFRWLQGFPKKSEMSDVSNGPDTHSIGRNDVVDFVVGMLKGAVFILYDENTVSIKGSCTSDGETHFVMTF